PSRRAATAAPAILPMLLIFTATAAGQQPTPLTLADADALALRNNPRIPAAEFTAQAAAQVPIEQRSVYLPNASVNITGVGADNGSRIAAGALNNPIVYDRFATGVTVNQFITDFGRTKNLIDSSKLHAQAQDQNTEVTKDQVVLQTDRAYFAVLRAIALLSVAQETIKA